MNCCEVRWSLDDSNKCLPEKCGARAVAKAIVIGAFGRGSRFLVCAEHAERVKHEPDWTVRPLG